MEKKTEISKIDFSLMVEARSRDLGLSLIESCLEVAEELDIEPMDIPRLIYPALKDKMEQEGIENRTIKPDNNATLDFLGA
ncbi:late promoter transcription accessory protein [Aeromonas phage phiAS5]|uniref:Late promoter transcription accessory protein n=1 Tax=Aeromonas phage phiAS5 TaxID=879630 RepID=E1A2K5_9CAUD|nr:late promoter transcriptional regulator [Aeromonas phage phiAS5]ADM79951.1 late promoter transcription accessory protein [Aeromonas phage phiAS5]BES53278.1 hypothetical protein [Aeromonas phage phiWae14]